MASDARPWFIPQSNLTARLSEQERRTFLRVCPAKTFSKDDTLFHEGDPADELHVIAEGRVKLVRLTPDGRERILAILGPDDIVGEAFLHDDAYYRADAVALGTVVTCPMSRAQFKQLNLQSPGFTLAFAETLADGLFRCRDQLAGSYAPIKVRVAEVLLDQARRFGRRVDGDPDWTDLETELRHEEIASLVSATRVSVSTAVAELRHHGLLTGTRGRYRLHMPALEAFTVEDRDAEDDLAEA